jgi:hypothetical protein
MSNHPRENDVERVDWNRPVKLTEFEKGVKEGLRLAAEEIIRKANDLDPMVKEQLLKSMKEG